jgi:hypothetical protein
MLPDSEKLKTIHAGNPRGVLGNHRSDTKKILSSSNFVSFRGSSSSPGAGGTVVQQPAQGGIIQFNA